MFTRRAIAVPSQSSESALDVPAVPSVLLQERWICGYVDSDISGLSEHGHLMSASFIKAPNAVLKSRDRLLKV